VSKALNESDVVAPVEIVHEHAWFGVYGPGPSDIVPEGDEMLAAPLQVEVDAASDTVLTVDTELIGGVATTPVFTAGAAAAPPLEYVATNPVLSTDPSATKLTNMLPEFAVTAPGTLEPLKLPRREPEELPPSYTFKMSYPPSVANDPNCSVIAEPVVIVHVQDWLDE